MMKELVAAVGLLALLAGCAAPPTGREPMNEIVFHAGPEPSADLAEQAVLEHLHAVLKDPDSLKQFEIESAPRLATWYRGIINGGGYDQGWLVCFRYNAKNSYGGYVGTRQDGVMLRGSGGDNYRVVQQVNWLLASARC